MTSTANRSLEQLEQAKREFGSNEAKLNRALSVLSRSAIKDADELIRFHEALVFFRAYPPTATLLRQVESILKALPAQVARLQDEDIDLSPLDDAEVSGIAGTSVTSNFSYALVRWLTARYSRQLSIDWDWFEEEERFGANMRRFLPLLEDDAAVEAHVPYRKWVERATRGRRQLDWIIERIESLQLETKSRAELYDALKLHVTWAFPLKASRTAMKQPVRKVFFHKEPLIPRRDISLTNELNSPPIPITRLARAEGEKMIDLARATSAVRYRELHGFTYGDPARVLRADLGRGTEAYVMGVAPENRLPLRAYHAALMLKNGVPVGYFEGISIFERMESGFNLYYTFREGETAWLYARVLRLMRQLLGVTVFSIDPYQVGHENEEGIESGAYWFYRKLKFRPVRPELLKLTETEEEKIASRTNYRTSARTLRKLAAGHMLFELTPSPKDWDGFEVRNIGLAVQQRMADRFAGKAEVMRAESIERVRKALGANTSSWNQAEQAAFENLALVFAIIPNLDQWDHSEKELATQVIRAKAHPDEARYLHLMQKHNRLREAMIKLSR